MPSEISSLIKWAPEFDPATLTYYDLKNRVFLLVVDTAQGKEAGIAGKKDSDYNVINIFEVEPMSPLKVEKNRNNQPITIRDVVQFKQVGIYMDNNKNEEWCAEACKYITFQVFKCGFKDIDNVRVLLEMNFNGNNWINHFKNHPQFYDNILIKTPRGTAQPNG